jgi:pimeloyl-ACP methyl ester carboxylesterase
MTSPLPTIVFLAGGFADPSCFDEVAALFQKEGYPTVYATVPSLNSSDARTATTSLDAQHVREKFLLPLLATGKDVIIVAHSYGGVVGGGAAFGLGKSAPSDQGGVIGFLCVPAVLTQEGQTLLEVLGGVWPPWLLIDYVCVEFTPEISDGVCT